VLLLLPLLLGILAGNIHSTVMLVPLVTTAVNASGMPGVVVVVVADVVVVDETDVVVVDENDVVVVDTVEVPVSVPEVVSNVVNVVMDDVVVDAVVVDAVVVDTVVVVDWVVVVRVDVVSRDVSRTQSALVLAHVLLKFHISDKSHVPSLSLP